MRSGTRLTRYGRSHQRRINGISAAGLELHRCGGLRHCTAVDRSQAKVFLIVGGSSRQGPLTCKGRRIFPHTEVRDDLRYRLSITYLSSLNFLALLASHSELFVRLSFSAEEQRLLL